MQRDNRASWGVHLDAHIAARGYIELIPARCCSVGQELVDCARTCITVRRAVKREPESTGPQIVGRHRGACRELRAAAISGSGGSNNILARQELAGQVEGKAAVTAIINAINDIAQVERPLAIARGVAFGAAVEVEREIRARGAIQGTLHDSAVQVFARREHGEVLQPICAGVTVVGVVGVNTIDA